MEMQASHGQTRVAGWRCICHSPSFLRLNARLSEALGEAPEPSFGLPSSSHDIVPREANAANAATPAAAAGGSAPASQSAAQTASQRGASAASQPHPPAVAFTNIRLFDGKSKTLRSGYRVIVSGNTITAVEPDDGQKLDGMQVVDGGGHTLMPGLIDAHAHIMMTSLPMNQLMVADIGFIHLAAASEAERMLMRGFTSIRDMAGPAFSLKKAIDLGMMTGPRIWPSGAMISQTSGHGDFRMPYEIPSHPGQSLSRGETLGAGAIADGTAEILKRAREQLMLGASQLKLAAGGGVASSYDPLDVSQYTQDEFRAAVDAAENWGTYVAVHAYMPRAIQTAVRGGVRCIEHGQLMDEGTAKLLAAEGIWISLQPFLDDEDAIFFPEGSPSRLKQIEMSNGTDTAYELAKKHGLKTAWGTDTLFDAKLATRQGAQLAKMARWYEPADVLTMATRINAELLAMAGPRNPYPGKLGVIEAGALADLLIVRGDPLANIQLIADPASNLALIMKDGRIFKDTLGVAFN
ncbi:metal-dependent hydrolase family protein [Paraburkholderia susongensis]|uniref:Imidazolonepropionase n=1 Tax=Paraburkholderia susongensis TaxID=1515439 RepID=A0A1X7IHB7_9BURK|nr:amidohydrolase family protein [Paraburkholderia susongensis]SMG13946.1 Imidazolonepropionase [Paraburkholderia susongensis]